MWKLNRERASLDVALRTLECGLHSRNDSNNGIHLGFLPNVRALEQSDPAEATTDLVLATGVRREVRQIAESWRLDTAISGNNQPGGKVGCQCWWDVAKGLRPAPAPWMIESAESQLSELRNRIRLAREKGLRRVAIPAISTK